MPRGNPSPKLAITIDLQVHNKIIAAATRDKVSVSAWMTQAGPRSTAAADRFGGGVRTQLRTSRPVRRSA
jgi:hypothetical protein